MIPSKEITESIEKLDESQRRALSHLLYLEAIDIMYGLLLKLNPPKEIREEVEKNLELAKSRISQKPST